MADESTPRPEPTPGTRPQQTHAPVTGEKFGKFLRTDRLGAGGMGEVWKAWDTELSRWVALKFLKGGDDEEIARFKREAKIAGKLSHANLGAIYEVGEASGRHYIAMQFVNGKTLRGWKGKPRDAATMIRDAALAVQSAHEREIVHRDLKPDNLMRDISGRLFVMDFGLARPAEGASKLSISGLVVGTPSYMPPEQALGKRVDARADVYSLGATLYELLTGAAPFRGESVLETLRKVEEEDAIAPRRLKPAIDADLETIVLKCMEKDATRRYATAAELAGDLTRWIDGEAILAHPASVFYRLRKKVMKRKALAIAALIGLLAVGAAVGLLLPALMRERAASERERAAKARAERITQLWTRVSAILAEVEANARAGELKRAIAKCDEGIAACADSLDLAETHYFLGRLQRVAGRREEAKREFDRAIEIDAAFGEARFERGLIRVEEYMIVMWRHIYAGSVPPRDEAGRTLVERLEIAHPELKAIRDAAMADLSVTIGKSAYFREVDSLYGKAELKGLRDDRARGLDLMKEVVDKDPLNARAWVALAREAANIGESEKAQELCSKAIQVHRGLGEAYYVRGQAQIGPIFDADEGAKKALADKARKDLDDAIAFGFDTPEAYVVRAQVRHYQEDYEGAIADATEALRLHPRFVLAFLFRAAAKEETGDARGALADYDLGAEIDPRNVHILTFRADAKKTLGDIDGAIADLVKAATLDPRSYDAWLKLGAIHREQKKYDEAMAELDRASKVKPWRCRPIAERAGILQDQNRLDEAVVEATRAIKAEGASWRGWFMRGMIHGQAGRIDDSLRDLEHALKLEPKLSTAWAGIGNCRAQKGDLDGALAAYGESLKLNPRSLQTLMNRATAHVMRKDWARAEGDYTAALELEPSNLGVLFRRADVRLKMGSKTGAIADLQRLLEIAPSNWPSRPTAEAMLKKARE